MAVEIKSSEELEAWLEDKPLEWAQVIGIRAALRIVPLALDNRSLVERRRRKIAALGILRLAVAATWSQRNIGRETQDGDALVGVLQANNIVIGSPPRAYVGPIASAGDSCASPEFARSTAVSAIAGSISAVTEEQGDASHAWAIVSSDANKLTKLRQAKSLLFGRLWRHAPARWLKAWKDAQRWLLETQENFEIWIEWIDGRIKGLSHAFPEFDDEADEKFYRWIVEQNIEWWSREPAEVNAQITDFVDTLRTPQPDDEEEVGDADQSQIKEVLGETSSPVFKWVNGRMTVVRSDVFASQTASPKDALKKRLLEAAKFLESCANRNAPDNLAGSFFAYHIHLTQNWEAPDPETLDIYALVVGTLRKNKEYEDWADGIGAATDKFLANHKAFISDTPGVPEQAERRSEITPKANADYAQAVGEFQIAAKELLRHIAESGLAREEALTHLSNQIDLVADMAFGPEPEPNLDEFFDLPEGWTPQTRALANIGGTYVSLRRNLVDSATVASLGVGIVSTTAFQNLTNELPRIDQIIQLIAALFKLAG